MELLIGDWRELLPPRGPFGLVFLDGGGFKHAPGASGDLVFGLLERGGLLVMDDMTPGRAELTLFARGRTATRGSGLQRC